MVICRVPNSSKVSKSMSLSSNSWMVGAYLIIVEHHWLVISLKVFVCALFGIGFSKYFKIFFRASCASSFMWPFGTLCTGMISKSYMRYLCPTCATLYYGYFSTNYLTVWWVEILNFSPLISYPLITVIMVMFHFLISCISF